MDISLFNSLPEKGRPHLSDAKISIADFLNSVKSGKYKLQIERIRTELDKANRDALKKQLPAVTISGIFTERKAELFYFLFNLGPLLWVFFPEKPFPF